MNSVIVDYRASDDIINRINALGFNTIPSFHSKQVSDALSGHPDLQICKLPNGIYVCSPESYEHYKSFLHDSDVSLICGTDELNSNYPLDIAYNVAWIGDFALHNFTYTDKKIMECLKKSDISCIHISQGYAKCNVCCVSDNAIITADKGIIKALSNYDIDVLSISSGYIDIFNWSEGFIGGTSGKLNSSTLAFCGNLMQHPDYNLIINFCSKYNVDCVSLSDKRLMDLGTVISIDRAISV